MIPNGPARGGSYAFWQVAVLLLMFLSLARMVLDIEGLYREARSRIGTIRPILDLARDVHADISKSTLCVMHDRSFEIHRVGGKAVKYYGGQGKLIRESDTGSDQYPLMQGSVTLGMDYGMIISRVMWQNRLYLFGAPPGWGITREELLAP